MYEVSEKQLPNLSATQKQQENTIIIEKNRQGKSILVPEGET